MYAKDARIGSFIRVKHISELVRNANKGIAYLPKDGDVGVVLHGSEKGRTFNSVKYGGAAYLLPAMSEVEETNEPIPAHLRYQAFPLDRYKVMTGSDPEVFVLDGNGEVMPAWTFLPSNKEAKQAGKRGRDLIFWDGFQAEFNTYPKACHEEVTYEFEYGLTQLLKLARVKDPKATLSHKSVVEIPIEMMKEASDEHAALGCSVSRNAYTEESPLHSLDPRMLPIRFAGCHIHIQTSGNLTEMVKALDAIAGVMMVPLLQGLEDTRRRKFYGLAGEFRTPPHGLEWRVPSSTIMCHPIVLNILLDISRVAWRLGYEGLHGAWETSDEEVQDIINNYNIEQALRVIDRNDGLWKEILRQTFVNVAEKVDILVKKGAKNFLPCDMSEWNGGPLFTWALASKEVMRA